MNKKVQKVIELVNKGMSIDYVAYVCHLSIFAVAMIIVGKVK